MNDMIEPAEIDTAAPPAQSTNGREPAAPAKNGKHPNALMPARAAFTRTKGIPFNGAQVAKVTENLPAEQRIALRWLYAHGKDKGDDLKRLAGRIDKSYATLYAVFKGEYGAKLDQLVEAINSYRALAEARDKVGRPPFIPTNLSQKIWDRCQDALTFQKVAPIIGDWQIGKTFALEAYAESHNHGQTRLVRMPSGAGYRTFLEYLARACYSASRCSMLDLRDGILASLDSRHLVIFDEVDEPLAGRFGLGAMEIYAFIREVYDRRRCGIVLCGNENFREALSEGGAFGPWMAKLRRRCLPTLNLPKTAPDEDLWAMAAHFGLHEPPDGEARDEARRVVEQEGIGEYVTILQTAKKISITVGQPVTWEHFLAGAGALDVTPNEKGGR